MTRRARSYEGDGIVVEYEAARCIHAKECVHGLPRVFDASARPWIQPAHAPADEIEAVVRRCPTGALGYRRTDGAEGEVPPPENTVRPAPDGPLYLTGELRLELAGGEVRKETRMALCRCGASAHKPFCDNSHVDAGFSDPGLVPADRLKTGSEVVDRTLAVTVKPNGPLVVRGPLELVPARGEASSGAQAALCRCGASESKPFCDGSHALIGFEAD